MPAPEIIYTNAKVITMAESFDEACNGLTDTAEAFATLDGRVTGVGSNQEVLATGGPRTRIVDLKGATVLPGFIDAHSHFPGSGLQGIRWTDLSAPPNGLVRNIASLVEEMGRWAGHSDGWVLGRGYDQTLLTETRHPTRWELDGVSPDRPVWVWHASGHMGVGNSRSLEVAGITANSANPTGGYIDKDPVSGQPTGLLQEAAARLIEREIPPPSGSERDLAAAHAMREYLGVGVTTSIIAGGDLPALEDLRRWRRAGTLAMRVIMMQWSNPTVTELTGDLEGEGDDWLSLGAHGESVHDGSLQGYTGYLSQPYFKVAADSGYDPSWRGFPIESRETLTERVSDLARLGLRSAIHANGDAAIDDLLFAYAAAADGSQACFRWRIEHAQTVRDDQLDRFNDLHISPSFFVSHVYYWGDQHRDTFLGLERARRISPLKSAIERGIRFSIHLDSPVVPMNPLHAVWCAVNRLTRSGQVLGPEERVTPHLALRAVTIDAAWQNLIDDTRGSIEPGKLADFVILAENPLTIDPLGIKDIEVLEVRIAGEPVHCINGTNEPGKAGRTDDVHN
ncbi:amidohydrolase [Leekyejoonella antrihumi]|uniref:Amidohydrolase n=1 Tax=Leekyejoonella antrihumi TaxID=1660198 RepID=A0A563E7I2_9MICO|nr:amidohydrolase [Leekyejoonella antrihumi]TWP38486.1 amidohydrolase [Leekyejoonella antrihumi]